MEKIAQLIKLKDYISRYELNIYRYPTQFIRLKQEQWLQLQEQWFMQQETGADAPQQQEQEVADSLFERWRKSIFSRKQTKIEESVVTEQLPESEKGLTQYFLDELFPFQLKWASSTVSEVSFTNRADEQDRVLHYFLQRFPDTYLVMYYPVFMVQQAPVEAEIILISPFGAEIIYMLEEEADAIITAKEGRTWEIRRRQGYTTILSPLISLRRTEQIIKSIFRRHDIDFPVLKTVLSRTNEIRCSGEPYNTAIVGKAQYKRWFEAKRKISSPLKSRQLKAAGTLLSYAKVTAVPRGEWMPEQDNTLDM